jgi:hypothetical protein
MISCSFPVTVPLHHVINLFRTVWFDDILQLNKTKPGYSILQNKSSTRATTQIHSKLKITNNNSVIGNTTSQVN